MTRRRAVGVVRVSQVAGREGDSFASPDVQTERIGSECERQDLELLEILRELDVSGGADLNHRPGLGPAVEAVEAGRADVIVAAYFDRFFRSLEVQAQVIARVEAAGGQVLAVDFGRVTNETASQWLSATVTGMMSEHYRRVGKERTAAAIQHAINRGVPPWPRVTPGYLKRGDGRYEPCPVLSPVVSEAFERRARGALVREVREYLGANGVRMTYPGVVKFLRSPTVLGEIHFGKFIPNLRAHDAIVDRDVWMTVQRTRIPAGRNTKSERLLARLGVLRCGTCDSKMVANIVIGSTSAGGGGGKSYSIYRCQNVDCARRVTISAPAAEGRIWDIAKHHHAEITGGASLAEGVGEAEARTVAAQAALDKAIRAFAALAGETVAAEVLATLTTKRDVAAAELQRLRGFESDETAGDPDTWPLAKRRRLIANVFRRVVVAPGRGADRLRFEPRD